VTHSLEELEECLADTNYNENRKNQLRQAFDRLGGGMPELRKARKCKDFVKRECYSKFPKAARTINSRGDESKVYLMPIFRRIEQELYKNKHFVKHIPIPERPEIIRQLRHAGNHYYQTDYTAFESHFTPEVMKATEFVLYRFMLGLCPDYYFIKDIFAGKNQLHNNIGIDATIIGRRMSGEMSTSVANGFANLIITLYLVDKKGGLVDGVVEGDDGLFSTNITLTKEDYDDCGFTIKIEEVDDPCAASFCGMIFAESGEIIRDPRVFMAKFGWTLSFLGAKTKVMEELLLAKSLSAIYETPQCPIVGELARLGRRLSYEPSGRKARFVDDGYHLPIDEDLPVPEFNPASSTRELFAHEFNISINEQLEIEAAIRSNEMAKVGALLPPTSQSGIGVYSSRYLEII